MTSPRAPRRRDHHGPHREAASRDDETTPAVGHRYATGLVASGRDLAGRIEVISPPDSFGSGFSSLLELDEGIKVTVQVFAGFESVPDQDLTRSKIAPAMLRVALHRDLADKVQCVVERREARDLVDIEAVARLRPNLRFALLRAVEARDALLLAERLLGWTDDAIRDDLKAYVDVDPQRAIAMRNELLVLVRSQNGAP